MVQSGVIIITSLAGDTAVSGLSLSAPLTEGTLKSPTGEELSYVLQIHFQATNNMAEYEALLHGLRIAKEIGVKHIICCGYSDLVAQQVAGT